MINQEPPRRVLSSAWRRAGRLTLAILLAALMLAAIARYAPARAQETSAPNLVLSGALTRVNHETYIEAPFRVPRGVAAITVALNYTGREQRTVVDLGVFDPQSLRGWSGGNKDRIVIGETSATPSYRPGPIQPGRWRLLLGVPNIRDASNDRYEARIWFHRGDEPAFSPTPLRSEARWYRGDLHMHTGHSDGVSTLIGPSLVSQTLERAREAGLDFIAVTDHNTTTAFNELRALQPAYHDLLLLPGREITTFQGHANVIGGTRPIDFRVSGRRTMNDVLADARGAFVSINHPSLPSGEGCMGCGWTAPNTDYARVQAVEIVNGGAAASLTNTAEGPLQGIAFWQRDSTRAIASSRSAAATTTIRCAATFSTAQSAAQRPWSSRASFHKTRSSTACAAAASSSTRTARQTGASISPPAMRAWAVSQMAQPSMSPSRSSGCRTRGSKSSWMAHARSCRLRGRATTRNRSHRLPTTAAAPATGSRQTCATRAAGWC